MFGVSFFALVGSTTAFVRFNFSPAAWPKAIAAMTIAFGVGQTLGPIFVGAITDAIGSLSYALNVSAAMLAVGAMRRRFSGGWRKHQWRQYAGLTRVKSISSRISKDDCRKPGNDGELNSR